MSASASVPVVGKPAHIREFTPRSVAVGLLVALVIGASYPYVVLKFGFGPNISVVSAFFGFLALGLLSKSYNRWENNIVQTAGTTAGQIAFLCWLLAAFDILAAEPNSGFDVHLTMVQTWIWLSAAGILGVFLAVPMRKHLIEDENLPYPDGMAAGETLIMLDSHGPQARKSSFAMMTAVVLSGLTFLATVLRWIRDSIPLVVNAFSTRVGLGFGVSLLSIGSGIIIGLRISVSMMIGGIIGWVLMPPWLLDRGLIAADARRVDILLIIMWPAVGMLIAGGLSGLLLRWRVLVKTFRDMTASTSTSEDLPLRWVFIGGGLAAVAMIAVQRIFFGTPVWHSLIAIALSVPLGLVALRVLGETNWGPISQMTNLTQAVFGVVAPGDLRASMVSSGITGAVAAESEGLMQDFRAGAMIHSTPRILTYMQLLAVPVGALALAAMYPLLRDTYGIIGDQAQLLSPTSQRWVGFAKLMTQDFSAAGRANPATAARVSWMLTSVAVGAVIGVALTVLEQRKEWRRFIPSPTGMGIAMVIPVNAVTMIFIGALADTIWSKISPATHERYSIPIASGLIAGEALVAVAIPLLVTVGLMDLP
ncbi:MAG TPA: OPT family oligopeptide transporter [Vicinamibacterales bacterium]|nr:OPT family oligopeptide transporter [Vicinamibacterales bacterium]